MEHVTAEQVVDAALSLLKRHKSLDKITLERVRAELGHRGSWSTIAPVLRDLRERLIASRVLVEDADLIILDEECGELDIVEPGGVRAEVDAHGRLNIVLRVRCPEE